jgi:phospholipase C
MRAKIKHVVYLMLENRSFDHVCGWLYENDPQCIHFVSAKPPFKGASTDLFNFDGNSDQAKCPVINLKKYENGQLSREWTLDFLGEDPYHALSDGVRQLFFSNRQGYAQRATPDMGGFVWNNGMPGVMSTYTPEQLPVLNGLAKHFAVSDEWFCSMPSETDPNRAFALMGSAIGTLNNFQNDDEYAYWPYTPHRPSIWKVLWANGFRDWKIYNSVEWFKFVLTYHLFLRGQIPSVDEAIKRVNDGLETWLRQRYGAFDVQKRPDCNIADHDQFLEDAKAGTLPAFSFLEPVWIGDAGTTSYHPLGRLVPGERWLNKTYEALRNGPKWEETLFIITFDEHGGLYDHVPPPYAENPWPNDVGDEFHYDLMGIRIPTILVSPWIKKHTVFRSTTSVAYDSTSILATLLHWYGIPKSRWGLGARTRHAPTFEGVFLESAPRKDAPQLTPPYDRDFPPEGGVVADAPVNSLYRLITPRLVWALVGGRKSIGESRRIADDILTRASDLKSLKGMLDDLASRQD